MTGKSIQHAAAYLRVPGKDLLGIAAQHLGSWFAEEGLDRGAHKHGALILCKQHQAILEIGHDLIDILLQRRKYFVDRAHLPADAFDLRADVSIFVSAIEFCGRRRGNLACAHLIQAA